MFDENASQLMALANLMNVKDSRWLQLEVCREFQRGSCSRSENECKFSHPPPHVEVQNGRVTACYDSIKGRCTRENPKCKYLHPPQHLKDQLLINGRNNLAVKNLLMNQFATPIAAPLGVSPLTMAGGGTLVPGVAAAYSPYAAYTINPAATAVYPSLVTSPEVFNSVSGMYTAGTVASPAVAAAMAFQAQKAASAANAASNRADRVEVCREFLRGSCQRSENECKYAHPQPYVDKGPDGTVTICMDFVRSQGAACAHSPCRYFHPPPHLWPQANAAGSAPGQGVIGAYGLTTRPLQNVCYSRNGVAGVTALSNGDASGHHHGHHQSPGPAALPTASAAAAASMAAAHAAAINVSHVLSGSKKRPLEQDTVQFSSTTDPYLLAAAALTAPMNKRVAFEKSGIPVYQPVTHVPVSIPATVHYPQLAAIPGLQTSYTSYLPFAFASNTLNALSALPPPQNVGLSCFSPNVAALGNINATAQAAYPFLCNNTSLPLNAASVAYFDESGQLLDTLPVCRDFKQGRCDRSNCRYVHLHEDYVEVNDGKVTVCRDFAKGKCTRMMCKYYHVPILPSSATLSAAAANRLPSPAVFGQTAAQSSSLLMTSSAAVERMAAQQQQQLATQQQQLAAVLAAAAAATGNSHVTSNNHHSLSNYFSTNPSSRLSSLAAAAAAAAEFPTVSLIPLSALNLNLAQQLTNGVQSTTAHLDQQTAALILAQCQQQQQQQNAATCSSAKVNGSSAG